MTDRYSVLAAELSDQAGTRRSPDKPNLRIVAVKGDPHLAFRKRQVSERGRAMIQRFGICVRDDLAPRDSFGSKTEADRAKRELFWDLSERGYTVNGYRTVWRLYVIELTDSVGRRTDPKYPWVYVGQTSLDVETRYRQHVEGARSRNGSPLFSNHVKRHHKCLRPDLYVSEPLLYSEKMAKREEARLAEQLRVAGYSVMGGH